MSDACREFLRVLDAQTPSPSGAGEPSGFEHSNECAACRAQLGAHLALRAAWQGAAQPRLAAGFGERLEDLLRAHPLPTRTRFLLALNWAGVLALAVALAARGWPSRYWLAPDALCWLGFLALGLPFVFVAARGRVPRLFRVLAPLLR